MSDRPTPAQPAARRARLRAAWHWMHRGSSMLGLLAAVVATYVYCAPQTALQYGQGIGHWLQARAEAQGPVQQLADVAAAQAPQLTSAQQSVADWLARRYNIAPLAMQQLVSRAWQAGHEEHLEPSLILAVIAVESSFNPFAQSSVGATGLMQVMTDMHSDKFALFGGRSASIDPLANLQVGAMVLKDAIRQGGSLRAGLEIYSGANTTAFADSYTGKVLAEQARLRSVAMGVKIPVHVPLAPRTPATRAVSAQRAAGVDDGGAPA